MNRTFTLIFIFLLSFVFFSPCTYGQQTPDTTRPALPPTPVPTGAGFDVIIKKNGEIVYGLVKEVGLDLIIYQRTDIPDGPYYTIPRVEVYAISYRNQVKDILAPMDAPLTPNLPGISNPYDRNPYYDYDLTRRRLFGNGILRFGLGFIRGVSKVKDADEYSTSATFPKISIGYDVYYRKNIRLGLQVAFGTNKFSNETFSSYDSTQSTGEIKENMFSVYLYGRYDLLDNSRSALRPYITAGIGINSSHVSTENTINFISNMDQVLLIKSGARAVGLGIIARIGADYYLNQNISVFADAGFGTSVLNIGVSYRLN